MKQSLQQSLQLLLWLSFWPYVFMIDYLYDRKSKEIKKSKALIKYSIWMILLTILNLYVNECL